MKAAVFYEPHQPLRVEDIPTPTPGPGEVLVRVAACGLCHTDLHYIDHGTPTFKKPPLVLGHETAGTVAQVGPGVAALQPGDRVLLPAVLSCGDCRMCRMGRENICENMRMFGNHIDGGFAEYVVAPAKDLFPLPASIPLEDGAIIADALTTPFHAVVYRGQVRPRDRVAVIGCGGIGLNAVQVAALQEAWVIAVDVIPEKLTLARRLGAQMTLNPREVERPDAYIRKVTDGGVDVAFECVGRSETQELAVACVRPGGRVVFVGYNPEKVALNAARIMFRELEIVGSLGCRPVCYPRVIDLVARGYLRLQELISHRFPLEEINQALDVLRQGKALRVLILPGGPAANTRPQ